MASKYPWLQPYRNNPWFQDHLAGERAYQSGVPFSYWSRIVASEFEGFEKPITCSGGHTSWWKATVGAYKCPTCGELELSNGQVIESTRCPVEPEPEAQPEQVCMEHRRQGYYWFGGAWTCKGCHRPEAEHETAGTTWARKNQH